MQNDDGYVLNFSFAGANIVYNNNLEKNIYSLSLRQIFKCYILPNLLLLSTLKQQV